MKRQNVFHEKSGKAHNLVSIHNKEKPKQAPKLQYVTYRKIVADDLKEDLAQRFQFVIQV